MAEKGHGCARIASRRKSKDRINAERQWNSKAGECIGNAMLLLDMQWSRNVWNCLVRA